MYAELSVQVITDTFGKDVVIYRIRVLRISSLELWLVGRHVATVVNVVCTYVCTL